MPSSDYYRKQAQLCAQPANAMALEHLAKPIGLPADDGSDMDRD